MRAWPPCWIAMRPRCGPSAEKRATLSATGQFPYVIDATATVAQNGLTTEGTTRIERPVTYTVDLSKSPLAVVWS